MVRLGLLVIWWVTNLSVKYNTMPALEQKLTCLQAAFGDYTTANAILNHILCWKYKKSVRFVVSIILHTSVVDGRKHLKEMQHYIYYSCIPSTNTCVNLAWVICLNTQTKWPVMALVKEAAEAVISLCNMKPCVLFLVTVSLKKKKRHDMTSFSHLYKAQLFSTCSHLPCLTASLSIYQLRLTDRILFVLIKTVWTHWAWQFGANNFNTVKTDTHINVWNVRFCYI